MGALTERTGEAGSVLGPFMARVEIEGYPNKACGAFLRPQDRDLFLYAVLLKEALHDRDNKTAREQLDRIKALPK